MCNHPNTPAPASPVRALLAETTGGPRCRSTTTKRHVCWGMAVGTAEWRVVHTDGRTGEWHTTEPMCTAHMRDFLALSDNIETRAVMYGPRCGWCGEPLDGRGMCSEFARAVRIRAAGPCTCTVCVVYGGDCARVFESEAADDTFRAHRAYFRVMLGRDAFRTMAWRGWGTHIVDEDAAADDWYSGARDRIAHPRSRKARKARRRAMAPVREDDGWNLGNTDDDDTFTPNDLNHGEGGDEFHTYTTPANWEESDNA